MHLVTASPGAAQLMQQWRRQIGSRTRRRVNIGARPFAVISHLVRGHYVTGQQIDLRRLTLVACYDERTDTGEIATRLVGVRAALTSEGLRFGGPALTCFDKNLRLSPIAEGHGQHLDARRIELMVTALTLERYLERCARHLFISRRRTPVLPVVTMPSCSCCLVDTSTLRKRQVIRLDALPHDLCGRAGTTEFDFFNTRFRLAR